MLFSNELERTKGIGNIRCWPAGQVGWLTMGRHVLRGSTRPKPPLAASATSCSARHGQKSPFARRFPFSGTHRLKSFCACASGAQCFPFVIKHGTRWHFAAHQKRRVFLCRRGKNEEVCSRESFSKTLGHFRYYCISSCEGEYFLYWMLNLVKCWGSENFFYVETFLDSCCKDHKWHFWKLWGLWFLHMKGIKLKVLFNVHK